MEKMMDITALNTVSEVDLIYRSKVKALARPQIKTAEDAYRLLLQNWDDNKIKFIEQFKVILLKKNNKVLGIFEASTGGVSGTVADAKLICIAALKTNASGIISSHNPQAVILNQVRLIKL